MLQDYFFLIEGNYRGPLEHRVIFQKNVPQVPTDQSLTNKSSPDFQMFFDLLFGCSHSRLVALPLSQLLLQLSGLFTVGVYLFQSAIPALHFISQLLLFSARFLNRRFDFRDLVLYRRYFGAVLPAATSERNHQRQRQTC